MNPSSTDTTVVSATENLADPEDGLTFRRVQTLAEYHECVDIQEETWGYNFRERVPTAILLVSQKLGGICAAAFSPEGRMLGFVFGQTGPYKGELVHWSDLLAVRAESRGHRVGERLKRYQRELCRSAGIKTIYWTFDPLVARNAHLNLRRLRARALEYVINMYGSNTGSPLHGTLDTDRWVAGWDTASASEMKITTPRENGVFVIHPAANGFAPEELTFSSAPVIRVAVPEDFESLAHDQRLAWRNATRRAFLHYIQLGYQVISFQRAAHGQPSFYELAADTQR